MYIEANSVWPSFRKIVYNQGGYIDNSSSPMRGGGLIAPSLRNISQFCFPGQKRKLFTLGSRGTDGGSWKKESTEKTEYILQPLP